VHLPTPGDGGCEDASCSASTLAVGRTNLVRVDEFGCRRNCIGGEEFLDENVRL